MTTKSGIAGRTYLERGEAVLVICGWSGKGPHNVWIRRADGTEVIRPFRGLRKPPEADPKENPCPRPA